MEAQLFAAQTKERRLTWAEWVFLSLFLIPCAVLPAFVSDLFPYSAYPMFSSFPEQMSTVTIVDQDGNRISPLLLRLHTDELFNASPRLGASLPQSLLPHDRLLNQLELTPIVESHFSVLPEHVVAIEITQTLLGRGTSGNAEVLDSTRHRFQRPGL